MKQKALLILLILGITAMTWAQERGRGPNNPDRPRRPAAETVTISGSLIIAHGMPAVKSGDNTYLIGRITRLAGFIDGLKEGAQVTVDGTAVTSSRDSKVKFLRPAKLTLGGKAYDLSSPAPAFGLNRQFGAPGQNRQFAPAPGNPRQFGAPGPNRHQGPHAPQKKHYHHQHNQRQHMGPRGR